MQTNYPHQRGTKERLDSVYDKQGNLWDIEGNVGETANDQASEGRKARIQVYSSLIWCQTIKADSATMHRAGVNVYSLEYIYIFRAYPVAEIQGRANLCSCKISNNTRQAALGGGAYTL